MACQAKHLHSFKKKKKGWLVVYVAVVHLKAN